MFAVRTRVSAVVCLDEGAFSICFVSPCSDGSPICTTEIKPLFISTRVLHVHNMYLEYLLSILFVLASTLVVLLSLYNLFMPLETWRINDVRFY